MTRVRQWRRWALPLLVMTMVTAIVVSRAVAASGAGAGVAERVDFQAIAKKLAEGTGRTFNLAVVDSESVFSRMEPASGKMEVSRALLEQVYSRSGTPGVAFLLGHEMGHCLTDDWLKGAAVEFEADRLGFDIARRAYPELDGETVKKVFNAFDETNGRNVAHNTLNKIRGSVSVSHPTDAARLEYLAKSHRYSSSLKFDTVTRGTGHLAIDSLRRRTRGVVNASTVTTPRTGGVSGAAASIGRDIMHGGIFMDVAVTAGLSLISTLKSGDTLSEGLAKTGRYLTSSTFLAGDLLGGVVGAALGSMIPIPGALAGAGLFGHAMASLPALGGAMVGAQIGVAAITLIKEGRFSLTNLVSSIDVLGLTFKSMGAALGMAVGSMVPIPVVGSLLGGIVGGYLADRALSLLRGIPQSSAADEHCPTDYVSSQLATVAAGKQQEIAPAMTGKPITIEHLKAARDRAYLEFITAGEAGRSKDAVEHLRDYRRYQQLIDERQALTSNGS